MAFAAVRVVSPPLGWGRALVFVAISLLAHALVVAALRARLFEPIVDAPPPLRTIDVALIAEAPPAPPVAAEPTAAAPTRRVVTARPAPAQGLGAGAATARAAPPRAAHAGEAAASLAPKASDREAGIALAANMAMELGEVGGALVAFPAAGTYVYRMRDSRQADATGTTTVEWKLDAGGRRYEAQLRSTMLGAPLTTLTSTGAIRRYGLAPERYVQAGATRAAQAANVDWERGIVTFSARSAARPARAGLQDRLSFQFQLMLLAQQLPGALRPGAIVAMEVAGAREVDLYRFLVVGTETVTTDAGVVVEAIKLDRAKERAGDSRVEVWLDPARRCVPVRLRFTDPRGNVIESLLESVREGS